ncbi:MAG TPA: hypothetical protein VGA25_12400 [Burkholderiales bacterium]
MPAATASHLQLVIGIVLFWLAIGTLSSYFLVTTEHHDPEIRKAGFVCLLIEHRGAKTILRCFGALFARMQHDLKRLLAP